MPNSTALNVRAGEQIMKQISARRQNQQAARWSGALLGLDLVYDYLAQGKTLTQALKLARQTALEQLQKAVAE